MKDYSKGPVIVLGSPRSATSLVAGGLEKMGVRMGNSFFQQDEFNPSGYVEDKSMSRFIDEILKDAGGDVINLPPEEEILKLSDKYSDRIKYELNNLKDKSWGWKVPPTSLVIKLFMPYLKDPKFIFCFRKSSEIGKSLKRKSPTFITEEHATNIGKEYNRRLLNFLKELIEQ